MRVSHVTREQIQAIVNAELKGTSSRSICRSVRARVRKAAVGAGSEAAQALADRLEVSVEEHVPLARWGSERAGQHAWRDLSARRTTASSRCSSGPPGSEGGRDPVRRLPAAARAARARAGRSCSSRRGGRGRCAWKRAHDRARARGHRSAISRIRGRLRADRGTLKRASIYVDLRYANGFAVRIPELQRTTAAGAATDRVARSRLQGQRKRQRPARMNRIRLMARKITRT